VRRSHKLILAAAAVAMPLSALAAVAAPQLASAGVTYFPITCALGGSVSYSPPLSYTGTASPTPNTESVVATGTLTGCLSSNSIDAGTTTGSTTLNISTPGAKVKVGKVTTYYAGRCSDFASATTLKALKGLNISVTWSNQGLGGTGTTVMTSAGGAVASNASLGLAGFNISTKFTSGDYLIKAGQVTAFLDNTGTIAACAVTPTASPISGSNIVSSVSTATA